MHPDLLPFIYLATNRQGVIVQLNLHAETHFHLSRDKLLKKNIRKLLADNPQILGMIEQTLEHGVLMKAYDHDLRLGKEVSRVHCYIAPRWEADETKQQANPSPSGCFMLIDPLLGITRAEQQESRRELGRRAGLMAAMLAHEVKNPLAGIKGAAQLMEDELTSEPDRNNLHSLNQLIVREVDRISDTLGQVEFLARETVAEKEPVNIHEVLHYVTRSLDPKLLKNIKLQQQFDPSLPEVAGERGLLIQLFINLLKNAAEALEKTKDPAITLTTRYRHDFRMRLRGKAALPIIVSIADNGPGIPDDLQPNLFDPYLTTKKSGSGLGLAIAQKIAAQHEGMLELTESRRGHTAFTVMLPVFRGKH